MSKTYEMMWDCAACGTKQLLGKTHRRCPSCGSPQDPDARYFPPPGREVEAKNHVFVGVDWSCGSCETPNSRAARFCVSCGMPRDGNADVALKGSRIVPRGLFGARRGRRSAPLVGDPLIGGARALGLVPRVSRRKLVVAAAVGALLLGALMVTLFWQRDVTVRVVDHAWVREVDVEKLAPRRDSSWCDGMPGDAYGVSRSREVRSHREIPDWQECHDVQRDNGDGTYTSTRECQTRYRREPIYDDKCHYTVDRWGRDRTERNAGAGRSPGAWPVVQASGGHGLGATRPGARRETLTVRVEDAAARVTHTCELDAARWQALEDGLEYPMRVRVVTGGAVCSSLRP